MKADFSKKIQELTLQSIGFYAFGLEA